MKKERQALILELIKKNTFTTQEDLLAELEKANMATTQATVSRDIKELGLVKKPGPHGGYRYSISGAKKNDGEYDRLFAHSALYVDRAENIIVLKCKNGTAQSCCVAFDSFELEDVVGTLAGDDTVFVLCRSTESAKIIERNIEELLKD